MSLTDRIAQEARSLHPGRTLATVLTAPLWLIGALVGLLVRGAWLLVAWTWTAILVGYQDTQKKRQRD